MTVVSMCHISSRPVVRSPTFGFAGCTRTRGRRQPYFRTRRYQVEADADTVPRRGARTARVPVGTCRYSGEVTMSPIAWTSERVSRRGEVRGQDDRLALGLDGVVEAFVEGHEAHKARQPAEASVAESSAGPRRRQVVSRGRGCGS